MDTDMFCVKYVKYFFYFRNNSGSTHLTAVENTSACMQGLLYFFSIGLIPLRVYPILEYTQRPYMVPVSRLLATIQNGKSGICVSTGECILYQSLTSQNRICGYRSRAITQILYLLAYVQPTLPCMNDDPTFQETINYDAQRNGFNNWVEKLQVSKLLEHLEIFSEKFYQIMQNQLYM